MGQKNHATSRVVKNCATSEDKKNHATSWDRKYDATSWDKKAELLKRMDTRTHGHAGALSAQNFLESAQNLNFCNAELAKQAVFHIFGTI